MLNSTSRLNKLKHFHFFVIATATTKIYTLSLHDALPIYSPELSGQCLPRAEHHRPWPGSDGRRPGLQGGRPRLRAELRSEEHTSELQSRENLVCRLLLEKKKNLAKIL